MATKKPSVASGSTSAKKKPAKKKASSSGKKPVANATTIKKGRALDGYVACGTVTNACLSAGIDRKTWYRWLESDPAFVKAVERAKEQVADGLEAEAIRRATSRNDPSDTLLIFLMKGLIPHKYGDKQTLEHTLKGPLVIQRSNGKAGS